jgi:hypothetical protein
MTNTITLTDEQMKALQSGQSITIEAPKPVIQKWEPKSGNYRLTNEFNIYESSVNNYITQNHGLQYQTRTHAEQAIKALRSHSRQLSWLAENDDGWVADWTNDRQLKYYVVYYTNESRYPYYCTRDIKHTGVVYMSEQNAEKLCKLLNDGIVEF